MRRTDDWFECSDGIRLSCTVWRPEETGAAGTAAHVRGGVLLIHGMAEHRRRYEHIAGALCDRGFLVWAYDQRGHGESAPEPNMRRRIFPDDNWRRLTEDARELSAALAGVVADKMSAVRAPTLFVLGHSMGSLVLRELLAAAPVKLCGAVLMGTAGGNRFKARVGQLLGAAVSVVRSPSAPSKLLNDLTFAGYNSRVPSAASAFDWLSRDPSEVDKYLKDPDCGEIMSAHFFRELARGITRVSSPRAFEGVARTTKLLFVSGTEDPVGGYGAGVREVAEQYRRAGVESVELRLYEGARHELLHETNRFQVVEEIVDRLDSWAAACEN